MKYAVSLLVSLMAMSAINVYALQNPSFEEVKDGKAAGWKLMKGYFRAERGVGHNGSGGVVWESAEPSKAQSACVATIGAKSGVAYRFSCLVHAENFVPGPGGTASICVEWYDAKGRWMAGDYSRKLSDRNTDWMEIGGATREIPAGAKKVQLSLYVTKGSKGRVSFDNVVVRPVKRDVVAFVFSSAYRDMAASGDVRFHASLYLGKDVKDDDIAAEFSYVGAHGCMKDACMFSLSMRKPKSRWLSLLSKLEVGSLFPAKLALPAVWSPITAFQSNCRQSECRSCG